MEQLDRQKSAFADLALGADPSAPYARLYRGRIVKQHENLARVDVEPDDQQLLPKMSNVPLWMPIGVAVRLKNPQTAVVRCLIGWADGRPDQPYVLLGEGPYGAPVEVTESYAIRAQLVEIGGPGLNPALDGVVRAATPCQITGAPHFVGGKTSLVVLAKEK